jgi:hypothetical protein
MDKCEATFTEDSYSLFIDLLMIAVWLEKLLKALSKKSQCRIAENIEPSKNGPQVDDGIWIVFNTLSLRSMIKIVTPWGSIDYCEGPKEIANIFSSLNSMVKLSFNGKYKVGQYDNSGIRKLILCPLGKTSRIRKESEKVPDLLVRGQWQAMSQMKTMIDNMPIK